MMPSLLTRVIPLPLNSPEEQEEEVRELQASCSTRHRHPCVPYQLISVLHSSHLGTSARLVTREIDVPALNRPLLPGYPVSIIMRRFPILSSESIVFLPVQFFVQCPQQLPSLDTAVASTNRSFPLVAPLSFLFRRCDRPPHKVDF